jgi:tRNA-Thr(GGU) m(6)t(6)A37 methyltransferase TsaA
MEPLAFVSNKRETISDDFWGDTVSEITLANDIPDEVFENIELFSHLEIIYFFNKVAAGDIVYSGRPRENPDYPLMGIFGQRKKNRPNRIGLCTVALVEHRGRSIFVKYLDAISGTPVLDIKPVIKEFGIKGELRQPEWVSDLMKQYWQ